MFSFRDIVGLSESRELSKLAIPNVACRRSSRSDLEFSWSDSTVNLKETVSSVSAPIALLFDSVSCSSRVNRSLLSLIASAFSVVISAFSLIASALAKIKEPINPIVRLSTKCGHCCWS